MNNFTNEKSDHDLSGKELVASSKVQKATMSNEVLVEHIKMYVSYVASAGATRLFQRKFKPHIKPCLRIVKTPSKGAGNLKGRLINQLIYTDKVGRKPIIISLEPHKPKLA